MVEYTKLEEEIWKIAKESSAVKTGSFKKIDLKKIIKKKDFLYNLQNHYSIRLYYDVVIDKKVFHSVLFPDPHSYQPSNPAEGIASGIMEDWEYAFKSIRFNGKWL